MKKRPLRFPGTIDELRAIMKVADELGVWQVMPAGYWRFCGHAGGVLNFLALHGHRELSGTAARRGRPERATDGGRPGFSRPSASSPVSESRLMRRNSRFYNRPQIGFWCSDQVPVSSPKPASSSPEDRTGGEANLVVMSGRREK